MVTKEVACGSRSPLVLIMVQRLDHYAHFEPYLLISVHRMDHYKHPKRGCRDKPNESIWRSLLKAINHRVTGPLTVCLDEFPYLAEKIAKSLPFTQGKQLILKLFTKIRPDEDQGNSLLPADVLTLL